MRSLQLTSAWVTVTCDVGIEGGAIVGGLGRAPVTQIEHRFQSHDQWPYWFDETKENICMDTEFNSTRNNFFHKNSRQDVTKNRFTETLLDENMNLRYLHANQPKSAWHSITTPPYSQKYQWVESTIHWTTRRLGLYLSTGEIYQPLQGLDRPIRPTQCCTQFKSFVGIKCFVPSISISFQCECYIIMQMKHTKNLNPERSELGTTLS